MLKDKSLEEFNRLLASSAPVPGGGGVSALAAALGAGLGVMVGCLTIGKKKYAKHEAELIVLTARARELQCELTALIDGDAACFEPLSRVYAMPKDAVGRDALLESCLCDAASVPMRIAQLSAEAIEIMGGFADFGSVLAISDAGCGASLCRTALEGAALNVFVNTRLMRNRDDAERLNKEVDALLEKYIPMADSLYASVKKRFK